MSREFIATYINSGGNETNSRKGVSELSKAVQYLPELSAHINQGGEEEDLLEVNSEALTAEKKGSLKQIMALDSATFPWSNYVKQ